MPSTEASKFNGPLIQLAITAVITGVIITSTQWVGRDANDTYRTPQWALATHLLTVIPAVPLGAYILWSKKGDALHRLLGRTWALMMMVTSVASFWVRGSTGHIGPIHIFSVVTLFSIPLAIYHIRKGNVIGHKRAMTGPYIGLLAAGLFALLPGRMLGSMIFG